MQRIREGLYLLEAGRTVNAYLIDAVQGLTLVDAGFVRCAPALFDEIRGGGFRVEDIARVIVTHAHADHIGGVAPLLRQKRVKVFAHPEDIPSLQGRSPLPAYRGWRGALIGLAEAVRNRPEAVEIVVPASPKEPIRSLPQWQVLHTPGHTRGSLSLFDPAHGVLLCGDALRNDGGRLRVSPEEFSADLAAAAESSRRLSLLDADVLCFGHGPPIRERAWRSLEVLLEAPPK